LKLKDLIKRAVEQSDASAAGNVADICRFKIGLDYHHTFELVRRMYPDLDAATWENLLYAATIC